MRKANKLIDQVVEKIITEYEQNTNKQNSSDFIIALLSMMDKPTKPQDKNVHVYDRTSIKAILVEHGKNGGRKDLEKLDYLYMVVKESLRLHPVAPFPPRECTEDTTIEGYHIPRKSRIIVNVWAIGHDQSVWSKLGEYVFGMQLGLTTVRLVVARLVHCFNMELPYGMKR
ncbi:hypothetical protein FNV43_RR00644 [Rhamnella rubrinervis]|uniref:Cytochrome P450 n=1 Tax=Rhamnella rubrinervis TaxID=2594499 RepID=A0A8K0HN71_9ROSA|nr:hypothetical protein FNV43_RR00644 [Rhamnella rubrinervis]